MKRRGMREKRRSGRVLPRLLTVCAVLLMLAVGLDFRLRPTIQQIVEHTASSSAVYTINSAMLEEIRRSDTGYSDIVHLTSAEDGIITSIQTDIVALNTLKARLTDAVMHSLSDQANSVVTVPLGTLLGNQFTAGYGPDMEIRIIPLEYVQSELYNRFDAAGINQTRHQIMLRTTVRFAAVLPGYTVQGSASTDFCIAETIIVGKVPDGYTVVGDDDSSTISKINDYKADR